MTKEQAAAYLAEIGFRPGIDSTRGHPKRQEIKVALAAINGQDAPPPPRRQPLPRPAPEPRKGTPRQPEDVKARGGRAKK